jgi:hypothetical protein
LHSLNRWHLTISVNARVNKFRLKDEDYPLHTTSLLSDGISKAPDGHWRIHPDRIPPQFSNSFPINPVDGKIAIAPGLVFEVAVSNESMPTLTQRDLDRYFSAGTGTRLWLAVKVFRDNHRAQHYVERNLR